MKKIIILLVVAVPMGLMAQGGKYRITGKIGSVSSPAKVFLTLHYMGEGVSFDSIVPKNGSFKFEGNINAPVRASLSVRHSDKGKREDDGLAMFLEPNTVIEVSSPDSAKNATVKGSKLTKDLHKLNQALKPVNDKWQALNAESMAWSSEQKKDRAIADEWLKRKLQVVAERQMLVKQFILKNPGTVVSLDALFSYLTFGVLIDRGDKSPEYADVSAMFLSLSEKLRNSKDGQKYAARLEKVKFTSGLNSGAYAPEFTQNDPNGTPVSFKSFRGKYVLVDFWASWCKPCRAGHPELVKTYQQFKDRGFTILGVSLDDPRTKAAWLKAIADDKLEWTQVSDLGGWKNAVAVQYGIRGVPRNFLIDPDGKIVAKNLHGEALREKLSEILK